MTVTVALVITLVILLFYAIRGFCKGLLNVIFSLLAIVVTMGLVTMITPTVSDYLINHTQIYEKIQERSISTVQEKVEEALVDNEATIDDQEKALDDSGIALPGIAKRNILKSVDSVLYSIMESSGIMEVLGEKMAMTIFRMAVFIGCFLLIYLILYLLYLMLNALVKLPGIRVVNKGAGIVAGLVKGLIVVWIIYLAASVLASTTLGGWFVSSIEANPITAFLYNNNLLVYLIMIFL